MNKLQRWLIKGVLGLKASSLTGSYQIINGTLTPITDNKHNYIDKAYSINDIVYAVVNMILDKVRVVPWYVYKVVDENSLKKYQSLISKKDLSGKDFNTALGLRSKALQEITSFDANTGRLDDLTKWANDSQTFQDFVTDGCGYKLLTGDKFQWADILDGGANKGIPNSFWMLPSQEIDILSQSNVFPQRELGYYFRTLSIKYEKESVLHERYWNPSWGAIGSQLYGMSPLKAALKRVNRNNSAQDASSAKFQNNGLEAIVYLDTPGINIQDAKNVASALKGQLINEYTGPRNHGKITTSGYKVGVANLGLSPVELGIIESEKWDALMICNLFGVPPELLGLTAKTYNNMIEAEKALTTRCALPLINCHEWNFNHKLQTDWGFKGKKVYVAPDITVYSELESNKQEIVNWTNGLIAISPNEQREQLGLHILEGEEFNIPWVKTTERQPITDYRMNEIDNALNMEDGQ